MNSVAKFLIFPSFFELSVRIFKSVAVFLRKSEKDLPTTSSTFAFSERVKKLSLVSTIFPASSIKTNASVVF